VKQVRILNNKFYLLTWNNEADLVGKVFSREKPEDLTGWAYRKKLNCYLKQEVGMDE